MIEDNIGYCSYHLMQVFFQRNVYCCIMAEVHVLKHGQINKVDRALNGGYRTVGSAAATPHPHILSGVCQKGQDHTALVPYTRPFQSIYIFS